MLPPVDARPHHDGSPLYVSTDAPALGDAVRVRLRVPHRYGHVAAVKTRSNPNHEPRFTPAVIVHHDGDATWWEAELLVENPVHGYRFVITRASGETHFLSQAGLSDIETRDDDDFRLSTFAPPPAWGAETVMYQVFPDRFARSAAADGRELPEWAEPAEWADEPIYQGPSTPRQFYGGDLDGITEHLDHLERLGATVLYLTPVFPGRSNHRYDAHSFDQVDPLLGGDEALIRLVEAAHARGIKVMGDLTLNHSGDAHEWFVAARARADAPERAFYYLDDDNGYVSWLGVESLPKLNWASDELRRRFIDGPDSVVGRWLRPPFSLDGWRIDVANMTGRLDNHDLNAEVRQLTQKTLREANPEALLLGESTNDAQSDMQGDGWHGAMTYASFTRAVWAWLSEPGPISWFFGLPYPVMPQYTGEQVAAANTRFTAAMPWRSRLHSMNALDTHDTARFVNRARPGAVPVAVGLSVSLPGIPVVFAGDEFGFTGENGEHSRTTIPWQSVDDHAATIDLYAAHLRLRREHPALSHGSLRWLHASDDALVFARETADEVVIVLAARADSDIVLDGIDGAAATRLIGSADIAPDARGARVADASGAHGPAARIRSTGMSFTAWQLPGVATPAFPGDGVPAAADSPQWSVVSRSDA